MISLKKSAYNIFIPYDNNQWIIFNSFSGALGLFDEQTKNRFDLGTLRDDETQTLLEKGILIASSRSELNEINADRANGILSKNNIHFRIWPTSVCNANCFYCFEQGIKHEVMKRSTAEQLLKFIDEKTPKDSNLYIEWFGGEPLCNVDLIDYISHGIKDICNKKNVRLSASMITNGSLIDDTVAYKMSHDWDITSVQVSFDGDRDHYNKVKKFSQPEKYSFDSVICSLEKLMVFNIHLSIRMNYTTDNYASLARLIDFFHSHKKFLMYKNIFYYVYPVWGSTDPSQYTSSTNADMCLLDLLKKLVVYGMSTPPKRLFRLNYRKNQCASCCVNSYTILPDGSLTKCSETYTEKIGDIYHGTQNKEIENIWIDTNIDKKCQECVYLPLCQGGCRASKFNVMPQCFAYKDILDDIIKWYVKYQQDKLFGQVCKK